ncbi:MAG: anaerobic ribonucleoside-triphosphate reductase [Erysipelotrichaceae bacterium]
MKVKKRDNSLVLFNSEKILKAINSANETLVEKATKEEVDVIFSDVLKKINRHYANSNEPLSVEDINDYVEESMMKYDCYMLAKVFIEYRYEHKLIRQANTTDESILSLIRQSNKDVMEENSNKDAYNIPTQRDLIAGIVSRDITDRILLPKRVSKAHIEGLIHFHDSDYAISPMTNCCLVNVKDMLDNGTMMNGKLVESPRSFQVACTVLTQIIAAVAGSQYGGQSIDVSHLGKYLRKSKVKFDKEIREICGDEVSEEIINKLINQRVLKEVQSGVQTIQYQINTLMSTNGQSPFVTLFMYLKADDEYVEENEMIIKEILNQRIQGIKNEKGVYITPAFPKLIYVLTDTNNLSGGKYDYLTKLAIKCSSKRMYPDYISEKVMKDNTNGFVFSPMGCRSFLSPFEDENGNYPFDGRFNQGVISLNLPNVALTAKKEKRDFFEVLDERLDICYEGLMYRHNSLLNTKAKVAPILWEYGAIARLDGEETINELLNSCYSTISLGYIGLYEASLLMTGEPQTGEKGYEFSLKLMQYLRSTTDKWKRETGLGFALYGTPAESLCYRFARLDKEHFGSVENITDKDYYTNSYHIDVREHVDAFTKLKLESAYQKISSGGCISYVELPNMNNNLEAMEALVKFIYDNVQYAEFNLKSDYCQVCGYDQEILIDDNGDWYCPNCHNKDKSKMNVVRRTCGYLGENFWNSGKTNEIKKRVTHL